MKWYMSLISPLLLSAFLVASETGLSQPNEGLSPTSLPKLERQAQEAEQKENHNEAIKIYQLLTTLSRENYEYFYKLGREYQRNQDWDKAIAAYKRSLELNSKDADVKLGWASVLLMKNDSKEDLLQAKDLFQQILKDYPDYKDAQDGLKKAYSLLHPTEEEKKKTEKEKTPQWVLNLEEQAKTASKKEYHWYAIETYLQLTQSFPNNSEYFYNLGREYVKVECHCEAIEALDTAITLKPDYYDALIALGGQYLYFKDYPTSLDLFLRAVEVAPNSVEALVAVAKAEAFLDDSLSAENYYIAALDLGPDNIDSLTSYTSFIYGLRRYSEAEVFYRYLADVNDDPNTYKGTLLDLSSHTKPSFIAKAGSAEEREKDLFTHQWVASLKYLNSEAGVIYPINDTFRASIRARTGYTRQDLLISHLTQFDVNSTGGSIRGEWFYNPYWTIVADLTMEWISNNKNDVLMPTKRGIKVEPTLNFTYAKGGDTLSFGETTDSIIFRNFAKLEVDVVTREAAYISYQHDFDNHRLIGVDAAWLWYQDPIRNQEQDIKPWVQLGVPYLEDLLSVRYQCDYRHFYHEVSGYYSFQYQLTNWLKTRFFKKWNETIRCELEYWHGWRTTRGRNPQQQIIVVPTQVFPVTTVENQIDQVNLTIGYTPTEYCDVSLAGMYYHDSFDYTIYGAKILLDWRF